jgi:ribosomal protein S18 acetylase RimI-like enzyme
MACEGLQIRPFEEDDLEEVVKLWETVFPDDPPWNEPRTVVRRKMGIQRDLFLVGQLNGRVVATVMGGFDGFRGWVYHLAVAPDLRRRGFGQKMMEVVESELLELGCPKVNLQIRASNQGVIEFYRTLGYDPENRVSMSKHLAQKTRRPTST